MDTDPAKAEVVKVLGARFASPAEAVGGRDLVVHTSAPPPDSRLSLDLLAPEAVVLDLSWYGDAEVRLSLGGAFHSGRLGIRASQVGTVSLAAWQPHPCRPACAGSRAAARSWFRRVDHRCLSLRRATRSDVEAGRGKMPALCHTVSYGEG